MDQNVLLVPSSAARHPFQFVAEDSSFAQRVIFVRPVLELHAVAVTRARATGMTVKVTVTRLQTNLKRGPPVRLEGYGVSHHPTLGPYVNGQVTSCCTRPLNSDAHPLTTPLRQFRPSHWQSGVLFLVTVTVRVLSQPQARR